MSAQFQRYQNASEYGEPNMKPARQNRPAILSRLAVTALPVLVAGAALAHGGGGGVGMGLEGAASFSIPPGYHILFVPFSISPLLTAALFVFFMVFLDSELAVRF